MSGAAKIPVAELRRSVLRSVSRSFYLSIRLFPSKLRDPIALAYLLARATDTIADTASLDREMRRQTLRALAARIQDATSPNELEKLRRAFISQQRDEAERRLLELLPEILRWLDSLPEGDRADVQDVLAKINRGQSLDVERFGERGEIRALHTAAELNEYTYLVAGCVGEFWTRVCARHLVRFADKSQAEMLALGVRYGQGLQLINILRDLGNDLRNGRCYLPQEELEQLGIAPAQIATAPQKIEPLLEKWRTEAGRGLAAGMDYACAIRWRRVRFATALPALIGARTLALLRAKNSTALETSVKIPRTEVRSIIRQTALGFGSPRVLRKIFAATKNNFSASA